MNSDILTIINNKYKIIDIIDNHSESEDIIMLDNPNNIEFR